MPATCPVPTEEQRRFAPIQARAVERLATEVMSALHDISDAMRAELRSADIDHDPTGFLTATLLQQIFCELCGADPVTFEGGDPAIAVAVIRNCTNIARHRWGADIPPPSKPGDRPPKPDEAAS